MWRRLSRHLDIAWLNFDQHLGIAWPEGHQEQAGASKHSQAKSHNKSNHHIKLNNFNNSPNESAHGKIFNFKKLSNDEFEYPLFSNPRLQPVVKKYVPPSICALRQPAHTYKKEWSTQVNISDAVTCGSILPPLMTATVWWQPQ